MKVLLSAYACEPNKGSEPSVGLNWAQALARRGYEVHVITRSNNRPAIETTQREPLLKFSYFDLPAWIRFWKYWPGGIYVYYLLWQIGAYRLAKRLHAKENFDLVQHITFVSFRQPSFMGFLGIPFIFGPVGGGETMPSNLRTGIPFFGRLTESLRDFGGRLVSVDPLMRLTFSHAQTVVCATEETLARIPQRYRKKAIVQRAIGINEWEIDGAQGMNMRKSHFLFAGRLLYWKGLHLLLRALHEVRGSVPDVKLKIIGDGGDRGWLERVARDAGVTDLVDWVAVVPHDEMRQEYRKSLALVFPSMHDSGGMVVVEALAAGLPVICLDRGGPGSIVTSACGVVLDSQMEDEKLVITKLAAALVRIATDAACRMRLSEGAIERAHEMTWDAAADAIYRSEASSEHIAEVALVTE
jgi:glycosyltransferase involved in cell wall biosynthesis